MDSLLTEVQLIKIPRPKFCCSKGQLRSTNSKDLSPSITSNGVGSPNTRSDHRSSSNGHSETINNSRHGAPRIPSGHNGTTTATTQGTNSTDSIHYLNGNFYPVEPPKDYFDDELHIETLAIRSDEDLNRVNLSRPPLTQAPGSGGTQGSTTPPSEISRTALVVNGNSAKRGLPGHLSDAKNKMNGN